MKIEAKIALTNWINILCIYLIWVAFNLIFQNRDDEAASQLIKWIPFIFYQTFIWAFIPLVFIAFALVLIDMLIFYETNGEKTVRKLVIETLILTFPLTLLEIFITKNGLSMAILIALIAGQSIRRKIIANLIARI